MRKSAKRLKLTVGVWVILAATSGAVLAGEDRAEDDRAQNASFEQSDLFVSGQEGYHTYRIPAIVVSTKGTVLAFCEGRKTSSADHGDIDLLLRRSFNGGSTWQATQLVHEEGGTAKITIGNPCPIVDREGTIHLVFCRNNARAFYTKSVDDGATFSHPCEITDAFRDFRFDWTRLASGPGHGLQIRSGRLVVPVWLNDGIGRNYRSAVIYSNNAGATWKAGGIVEPLVRDCSECMAVERLDGSLLLDMRSKDAKCRATTVSTDGGLTWSTPKLVEQLVDPTCQASIVRVSLGDDAGQGGVVFCNAASLRRDHATVRFSRDDGNTWPVARLIHAGPSAYSDLAVTKDGTILCFLENGSKSPYEKLTLARFNLDWLAASGE